MCKTFGQRTENFAEHTIELVIADPQTCSSLSLFLDLGLDSEGSRNGEQHTMKLGVVRLDEVFPQISQGPKVIYR
jgi:hypothetical protein